MTRNSWPESVLRPSPWRHTADLLALTARLAVLLVPAGLLTALTAGLPPVMRPVGVIGAVVSVFLAVLLFPVARVRQTPANAAVMAVYLIALFWAWVGAGWVPTEPLPNFILAVLSAVPAWIAALQYLDGTGATSNRRSRLVGERILRRHDWPGDLEECRRLPIVSELREAVLSDPGPALALLADPRPAVRVTALAALEYRTDWRAGRADYVLPFARHAESAAERAAAVAAIAQCDDRYVIEALAGNLTDPDPIVRRTAAEALLVNAPRRWGWIRYQVHDALADPMTADDGPLPTGGATLPQQAIDDLVGWTGETGVAKRAAATLTEYFAHKLNSRLGPELHGQLKRLIVDPKVAAVLRTDLTQLLGEHGALSAKELARLLDPVHPASVRLLAADLILADESAAATSALDTLRELARLPNREIALRIASVVQKRLNVDLGLPAGPLPAKRSPEAVEVTRRVRVWADAPPRDLDETPRAAGARIGIAPPTAAGPPPGPRFGIADVAGTLFSTG